VIHQHEQHEHVERYRSVDDVLGDAGVRFFGNGYRQVYQRVLDVRIDTPSRSATAVAEVIYPNSWSTKQERELTPHLSSIDSFVIAAQIVEAYVREAYGVDDVTSRRCWLRHCTIRSGPAPTLELNVIPVHMLLTKTAPDATTICGYLSEFKLKVGTISVDLELDHPVFVERQVRTIFSDVDACLGAQQRRYYGCGYKATSIGVSDLVLNRPADRAHAQFSLGFAANSSPAGLSGSYFPFISIVDALVGTAQLTQAVLYRQDNLTRASSGNMWMRRISVNVPRPMEPAPSFDVETWIHQANVVPIGDQRWRTAKFKVKYPSLEAGEYSVAHQLPDATGPKQQASLSSAVVEL
jgi:hypothetical protein